MWRHIDVQADWRSWTYGRAPTPYTFRRVFKRARPSTDTGPPFLYGDFDTPPYLVAFYDQAGDTEDTFSS